MRLILVVKWALGDHDPVSVCAFDEVDRPTTSAAKSGAGCPKGSKSQTVRVTHHHAPRTHHCAREPSFRNEARHRRTNSILEPVLENARAEEDIHREGAKAALARHVLTSLRSRFFRQHYPSVSSLCHCPLLCHKSIDRWCLLIRQPPQRAANG